MIRLLLLNSLKPLTGNALQELIEGFSGFADEAGQLDFCHPTFAAVTSRVESIFNYLENETIFF